MKVVGVLVGGVGLGFPIVSPDVGPWLVGFGWLVGYVVGCGAGGWLGVTVQK